MAVRPIASASKGQARARSSCWQATPRCDDHPSLFHHVTVKISSPWVSSGKLHGLRRPLVVQQKICPSQLVALEIRQQAPQFTDSCVDVHCEANGSLFLVLHVQPLASGNAVSNCALKPAQGFRVRDGRHRRHIRLHRDHSSKLTEKDETNWHVISSRKKRRRCGQLPVRTREPVLDVLGVLWGKEKENKKKYECILF